MSWIAQPYQGLGVELARSLAAQPQSGADLTVEGGSIALQAVVSGDDVPETRCQALEQRVKRMPYASRFPNLVWG
jgi:hypothetical protein